MQGGGTNVRKNEEGIVMFEGLEQITIKRINKRRDYFPKSN